jgi:hypothetical protein
MSELTILTMVISIVLILVVLAPFFYGEGGSLQDASKTDSPELLGAKQDAILRRWIEDEKAANVGLITAKEWSMRKVYLTNRYIDCARRLDWLGHGGDKN